MKDSNAGIGRKVWHTEAWNMILTRESLIHVLEFCRKEVISQENAHEIAEYLGGLDGFELNRELFGEWPYMPLKAMESARDIERFMYPALGDPYPVEMMKEFVEKYVPAMLDAAEKVIESAVLEGLMDNGNSYTPFEIVRRRIDDGYRQAVKSGRFRHHGKGA